MMTDPELEHVQALIDLCDIALDAMWFYYSGPDVIDEDMFWVPVKEILCEHRDRLEADQWQ